MNLREATNYIKTNIDIVDYLSSHYEMKFKKVGSNYTALCPLHEDTDPSFSVSKAKGLWKCFGCGEAGTLPLFVMKKDRLSLPEAVDLIMRNIGHTTHTTTIELILFSMRAYFMQCAIDHSPIFGSFFESKGINAREVLSHGVGYCNSHEKLIEELLKSYPVEAIIPYNVYSSQFDDAIIYPVYDAHYELRYFISRKLSGEPKYFFPAQDTKGYVYDLLYGIHALRPRDQVIFVEGVNDYFALKLAGYNVLALNGLKISEDNIDLIRDVYEIDQFIFWMDGDAAGWRFLSGLADQYGDWFSQRNITAKAIWVRGCDPDECVESAKTYISEAKLLPIWEIEKTELNTITVHDVIKAINNYNAVDVDIMLDYISRRTLIPVDRLIDYYNQYHNQDIVALDAEKRALACALNDYNEAATRGLTEEMFSSLHYRAMFNLTRQGYNLINIRSVYDRVTENELIQFALPDWQKLKDVIKLLTSLTERRAAQKIAKTIFKNKMDITQVYEYVIEEAVKLDDKSGVITATDAMRSAIDQLVMRDGLMGFDLGQDWRLVNQALLGIRRQCLIMISANTGHGKTNLALNWCYVLSIRQSLKGLFFTGEMRPDELIKRVISIHAGLNGTNIVSGNLSDADMNKIIDMTADCDLSNLFFNREMNGNKIFSIIKYSKKKYAIDYVVIDYLQLVNVEAIKGMKGRSRTEKLKEFTRLLKEEVSIDLDIPVIVLSQLGDSALDESVPQSRFNSESKLVQQDCDVTIAMQKKSDKARAIEPRGNMIMNIDKVRYNRVGGLVNVDFDDITLRMREA